MPLIKHCIRFWAKSVPSYWHCNQFGLIHMLVNVSYECASWLVQAGQHLKHMHHTTLCQPLKNKTKKQPSPAQPNINRKFAKGANQNSVTDDMRLWNEFISLESLVWSCEQNIFLCSSSSKSQCNNIFQHNIKWCWRERKKTVSGLMWQRSRGC